MNGDVVISAETLGKKYLIGHNSAERERYTALRDVLGRSALGFMRSAANMARGRQLVAGDEVEEFWALRDVDFEIRRGEVVGFIGRNGAGKSTLLKVLSRITEPSEGRVEIRGRVASLLEVGTGFHPELSGRENIYLNGAILGMTRAEIKRKFDEIVDFAGVEKFLDTPVKRYSSGMYVRLAFAVAAHLEPEILIVDEVLAVGDSEFQKKCLGKMKDVAGHGRTVLFVSHNMGAISNLCSRAIVMRGGTINFKGTTDQAISSYLSLEARDPIYVAPKVSSNDNPRIVRIEVVTSDADATQRFGEPMKIKIQIAHEQAIYKACLSMQIVNQFDQPIIHSTAYYTDIEFGVRSNRSDLECVFPSLRLNVGVYSLRLFLSGPPNGERYEGLHGVCSFEVVRVDKEILWGWRPEVCAYHEQVSWARISP